MTTARRRTDGAARPDAVWTIVLAITTAGLGAALTLLFLGMRAVMEVGGACASGGPYEIATPCPDGVAPIVAASIPLGLLIGGVGLVASFRLDAPLVAPWAWPVLFVSLGYNFWEFGIASPGGGVEWGWVVCAIAFTLLGGVPVWIHLSSPQRGTLRWGRTARWWVLHLVSAIAGLALGWWFFDVVTR